jgi:hypothetical protein
MSSLNYYILKKTIPMNNMTGKIIIGPPMGIIGGDRSLLELIRSKSDYSDYSFPHFPPVPITIGKFTTNKLYGNQDDVMCVVPKGRSGINITDTFVKETEWNNPVRSCDNLRVRGVFKNCGDHNVKR